jgi:hypothetical protein
MRIESDSVIKYPLEVTFRTYRDELPQFVDHLPNVRAIRVESRDETEGVVTLVNVWEGGGDIPAAVRNLLHEDMLTWNDYATWKEAEHLCEWNIQTHAFEEAVHCSGTNKFIPIDEGRTRVELRGDLAIDLKRVRGVPSFLAGSLGRTVEQFLVKQITTNLTSVSAGLSAYLAERQ